MDDRETDNSTAAGSSGECLPHPLFPLPSPPDMTPLLATVLQSSAEAHTAMMRAVLESRLAPPQGPLEKPADSSAHA